MPDVGGVVNPDAEAMSENAMVSLGLLGELVSSVALAPKICAMVLAILIVC